MKANLMNRTIEMTKNEAKAAGKITSDKFKELREYQEAYPTFTIAIVATPKRKSQYKGLNYKYMEKYINNCNRENKDEIMKEFNELRGLDNVNRDEFEKVKVTSYLKVQTWFLGKFPEIKEFKENQSKRIDEILNVA